MMDRSSLRSSVLRIGRQARRDQPDPACAGSVRGIDEASHVIEEDLIVRLDKQRSIGAGAEDLAQAWKERREIQHFLIEKNPAVSIEAEDEAPLGMLILFGRRSLIRNARVKTLGRQGRDHHEDHEQDEQNVDKRGDVDVGLDSHVRLRLVVDTTGDGNVPGRVIMNGVGSAGKKKCEIEEWESLSSKNGQS